MAAPCDVTKADKPATKSGATVIERADGDKIYLVGHTHKGDDLDLLFNSVKDDPADNKDFLARLNKSLAENAEPYNDAVAEADFLREALRNDEFSFVAEEAPAEGGTDVWKWILEVDAKNLKVEFQKRSIDNDRLQEQLLLTYGGAANYLHWKSPIFKVPLLGVDTNVLYAQENLPLEAGIKLHKILQQFPDHEHPIYKLTVEIFVKISQQYPEYASMREEDLKIYTDLFPEKYRALAKDWLIAEQKKFRQMREREFHITKRLMAQKGSGVLFIGGLHLTGLIYDLYLICKTGKPYPTSWKDMSQNKSEEVALALPAKAATESKKAGAVPQINVQQESRTGR